MKESRLFKLLAEKKPAVGCWITLAEPSIAIILAKAGYDWVMVDTEHNPFTETQVQGIIHALRDTDVTPVVRVRSNEPGHIKWVLDAGAGGVIVPMIENAEDAQRAVEAVKYQPLGNRGYGPMRATDFWLHHKEYNRRANKEIPLICQIERVGAVDDIDRIAQMQGVDAVWIGPGDLAHSLGHMGDIKHPDVEAVVSRIIDAAEKHGKPWGIPVGTAEDLVRYVKRGGLVMTLGSDSSLLNSSSTRLAEAGLAALADAGLRRQEKSTVKADGS